MTGRPAPGLPGVRVQPFFCPYCAEEDLRPLGAGAYHCPACDRRFALAFSGLGAPTGSDDDNRED